MYNFHKIISLTLHSSYKSVSDILKGLEFKKVLLEQTCSDFYKGEKLFLMGIT